MPARSPYEATNRFTRQSPGQSQTPGIWPMRPRLPQGGQFQPPPPPDVDIPEPEGYAEVPNAYDPLDQVAGYASYDGPELNTEGALAGLRAAQSRQNVGQNQLPTSELFRLSHRPSGQIPGTPYGTYVAPGSNEYFSHMLNDRLGDQAFSKELDRNRQGTIEGAITQHHPAVQEALEAEAERRALPAIESGRAAIDAATIGAQGRYATAGATMAGRQATAQGTQSAAVIRALGGLMQPFQGEDESDVQMRIQTFLRYLDALQRMGVSLDPGMLDDQDDY